MSPFELKSLAARKFGPERWLQGLAYAMGVSERTIRRWAAGEIPIKARIAAQVEQACEGDPVTVRLIREESV